MIGDPIMEQVNSRNRWLATAILLVIPVVLALAGCVTGKYVSGQAVDVTKALSADVGDKKWNTYRFETGGPFQYQRIAYVLFSDDVAMDMRGIPYADLGKKTMREVLGDHEAYLSARMWTGTALVFKRYDREGKAVAFSANEFDMDVDLWETTASGAKPRLQVVCIDRRPIGDSSE
jgi:hypothetical protein